MDKGRIFRTLHEGEDLFVVPNPWDPGTTRFLETFGFKALATSSAGFAFSRALPDGAVTFDAMMAHCKDIVGATSLPVSADLEKGKGDSPDSAAETIFAADAAGLAGCSIEDHTGDPEHPIYDFNQAVERVAAAAEATRALKHDFVFTARAENFLWGRPALDDTINRLNAFARAGADVVYAPGISDIAMIRAICQAVPKPVNVMALPSLTVAELRDAGVRRVTLGPRLTTAAFGAVRRAVREILDSGTFTFANDAEPFATLQALYAAR